VIFKALATGLLQRERLDDICPVESVDGTHQDFGYEVPPRRVLRDRGLFVNPRGLFVNPRGLTLPLNELLVIHS
jgi:hypothetical protein